MPMRLVPETKVITSSELEAGEPLSEWALRAARLSLDLSFPM